MFEKQPLKRLQRKKAEGRGLAARAAELMREEALPTRRRKRGRAAKAVAVAVGLGLAKAARRAGASLASAPARGRAAGKKARGRGRTTTERTASGTRRAGEGMMMGSLSRQPQAIAARRGSARRGVAVKAGVKKASTTKRPARRKGASVSTRKMGRGRSRSS
jgi:hypothetical protein